jgi:hypothetical protein
MRRLFAMLTLCVLVAACSTVTPTPSVTPTPPAPFTPHPSNTAATTATRTPTATPTATATMTAIACATCPAIQPALMGSVILWSWLDTEDDRRWDLATEVGITATALLRTAEALPPDAGLPELIELTSSSMGVGVLGMVAPGGYYLTLKGYQGAECNVADDQNYTWLTVSPGHTTVIPWRFWVQAWCAPPPVLPPTMTPYPGQTTPTATPTPVGSHECVNYATNCVPLAQECGAGRVEDVTGVCGIGWRCCKVTP